MSSYYDSDDDVAWGPLTLREIKRTLNNPPLGKVDRRHTLQARSEVINKSKVNPKINKMMDPVDDTSLSKNVLMKCNITSSSNEYYTPNATVNDKVQYLPSANSSVYKSCAEDQLAYKAGLEDTHVKFLRLAKNRETECDLNNIQQTLVEPTILNDSSESKKSFIEMNDSCMMNSIESSENSQHFEDDDIIVLSSDDDNISFVTAKTITSQNKMSIKRESNEIIFHQYDADFSDSSRSSNNSSIINNENQDKNIDITNKKHEVENYEFKRGFNELGNHEYDENSSNSSRFSNTSSIMNNKNWDENISDKEHEVQNSFTEESFSSSISDNQLEIPTEPDKDNTVGGERPLPYSNFSPVQVPQLNLADFDESEDCLKLNDTLEEIERMLNAEQENCEVSQCSNNLSSEESSSSHAKSSHLPTSPQLPTSSHMLNPVHIISGSFSQSPSHTNFDREIAPSKMVPCGRTPTPSKLKPPSKVCYEFKTDKAMVLPTVKSRKIEEVVSKIATPTGKFRVPKTPVKPKSTVLNNKNIVSPVGLYIKYSPKTPLTTHVKQSPQKKIVSHSQIPQPQNFAKNKENLEHFPEVVYQPAKNKLYTVKEHLHLPASIDKLVKKSNVIKHEKRMHLGMHDENPVGLRLETETELTKGSIGDSLLDESNQDVSVLASRQAFKK